MPKPQSVIYVTSSRVAHCALCALCAFVGSLAEFHLSTYASSQSFATGCSEWGPFTGNDGGTEPDQTWHAAEQKPVAAVTVAGMANAVPTDRQEHINSGEARVPDHNDAFTADGGNRTNIPPERLPLREMRRGRRRLSEAGAGGGGGVKLSRVEHFPTAFTEHFPVVHHAKYKLGMPVVTAMDIVAFHAKLPDYSLKWHTEPTSIWDEWLRPYLGELLSAPALRETRPPESWCEGLTADERWQKPSCALLQGQVY